jgi:DNA-binding beta-propeller fold protein YncE
MFADLNTPYGIAFDTSQKTLYVTDWSGQGSIVQIDIASSYKSTLLAGFMHCTLTIVTGILTAFLSAAVYSWNYPLGIAVDKNNNIFVSDLHRVCQIGIGFIAGANGLLSQI